MLESSQRAEKVMKHENVSDTNSNWCTRNGLQRLEKKENLKSEEESRPQRY